MNSSPGIVIALCIMGFSGEQERSLEWWCSGQKIASGSQGAAIRSLINGCGESEISLASGQPVIRLNGVMGSMPRSRHEPEGCNGRAPASPLPSGVALACSRDEAGQTRQLRSICLTTHILRSDLISSFETYV